MTRNPWNLELHARRLERRRRGRGGQRRGAHGTWHRWRGLHPHPRRVLRGLRPQALVGRVPVHPACPAEPSGSPRGPDHAHRARRGGGARRRRGRRRPRPPLAAREAGPFLEACNDAVKGLHVAWSADLGLRGGGPRGPARCARTRPRSSRSLGCHVEVVSPGLGESRGDLRHADRRAVLCRVVRSAARRRAAHGPLARAVHSQAGRA